MIRYYPHCYSDKSFVNCPSQTQHFYKNRKENEFEILNYFSTIFLLQSRPTDQDKINELLQLLPKRGPEAFNCFLDSIKVHSSWLADKLQQTHQKLINGKNALFFQILRYHYLSHSMRFLTMWYVRPAKAQTILSSLIRAFFSLEYSMTVMLLTAHHLEFQSLKRGLHKLVGVYTCQNATLLEISCHASFSMPFFLCEN